MVFAYLFENRFDFPIHFLGAIPSSTDATIRSLFPAVSQILQAPSDTEYSVYSITERTFGSVNLDTHPTTGIFAFVLPATAELPTLTLKLPPCFEIDPASYFSIPDEGGPRCIATGLPIGIFAQGLSIDRFLSTRLVFVWEYFQPGPPLCAIRCLPNQSEADYAFFIAKTLRLSYDPALDALILHSGASFTPDGLSGWPKRGLKADPLNAITFRIERGVPQSDSTPMVNVVALFSTDGGFVDRRSAKLFCPEIDDSAILEAFQPGNCDAWVVSEKHAGVALRDLPRPITSDLVIRFDPPALETVATRAIVHCVGRRRFPAFGDPLRLAIFPDETVGKLFDRVKALMRIPGGQMGFCLLDIRRRSKMSMRCWAKFTETVGVALERADGDQKEEIVVSVVAEAGVGMICYR
jgi:hypothetical protein